MEQSLTSVSDVDFVAANFYGKESDFEIYRD